MVGIGADVSDNDNVPTSRGLPIDPKVGDPSGVPRVDPGALFVPSAAVSAELRLCFRKASWDLLRFRGGFFLGLKNLGIRDDGLTSEIPVNSAEEGTLVDRVDADDPEAGDCEEGGDKVDGFNLRYLPKKDFFGTCSDGEEGVPILLRLGVRC